MKKSVLVFLLVFLMAVAWSGLASAQGIPLPFRLGGTVTLDGSRITQANDEGLLVTVAKKGGGTYTDAGGRPPEDRDGVNAGKFYLLDVPTFHKDYQPKGAQPSETAVIQVFVKACEYHVVSPPNGEFQVGAAGTMAQLNIVAESFPDTALTLLSPTGGESWKAGTAPVVQWHYRGNPGSLIRIELLKGGRLQSILADEIPIGNGGYPWLIPSDQPSGKNYKVRLTSTTDVSHTDTGGAFSIVGQASTTLSVTSPNGMENWLAGSTRDITWTYTGSPGTAVAIVLLKDGKIDRTLSESTAIGKAGKGSYSWKIPADLNPATNYRVEVTSKSNSQYQDQSNQNFTVSAPPAITVTAPNGGEIWNLGSTQALQWTYTGDPGEWVKIELLKGGVLQSTLTESTSSGQNGGGSFQWSIPPSLAPGGDYLVRITSSSGGAGTDTSDGNFTLAVAPAITVTTPNGGESWTVGTTQTIFWAYAGVPGATVRLELLAEGSVQSILAAAAPIGSNGNGSFEWPISADLPAGDQYTIRVVSTSNESCQDSSDGVFALTGVPVLPNLTPSTPDGWADKIVLSYIPGTHDDDRPIFPEDIVFVDWAVQNTGTVSIQGEVQFDLYLDDQLLDSWTVNYEDWSPGYFVRLEDYPVESLAAGPHTITLVVDPANAVKESDEADNQYSKAFTVQTEF